jgi:hypothetical protein
MDQIDIPGSVSAVVIKNGDPRPIRLQGDILQPDPVTVPLIEANVFSCRHRSEVNIRACRRLEMSASRLAMSTCPPACQ